MKKIWYAPNGLEAYGDAEIDAVTKCLRDGWLAGFGKYTIEFENRVATMFGKKHGLFVNSGSSACLLALACLDLPAGSEVITPACTFATTVSPILQLDLKPVFIDVQLHAYVPSVEQVIEKINPNTRAIMLPNLIGNLPDWKVLRQTLQELNRTDIVLVEDSADTIIHSPHSDISTTSFYSSHMITACGSGGMVMFNDAKYLKRATMFRDWGRIGDNSEEMSDRFTHEVDGIRYDYKFLYGVRGYNMKSSEVNAAFGLIQLDRFEDIKTKRRMNFERYIHNLTDVLDVILPCDCRRPNWLAIPLQISDRLDLLTFLEANNIQTRVTFSGNITRHPAYREFLQPFPNADRIMKNGFLLGCHHGMTVDDVDIVCNKIREFIKIKADHGLKYPLTTPFTKELPKLGFLFPRHVSQPAHRDIWKECLRSIRTHYKTEPVVIIDDNSTPEFIEPLSQDDEWLMRNVTVVQSEFPRAGEVLPYYYFHKLRPCQKAVIINDSMFVRKPFDPAVIDGVNDVKFLWDFGSISDNPGLQIEMYGKMRDSDRFAQLQNSGAWTGCFASASIMDIGFIDRLQNNYDFLKVAAFMDSREKRCAFERVLAVACACERGNINDISLFGNIYSHPSSFSYSFEAYKANPFDLPVVKCWNSR